MVRIETNYTTESTRFTVAGKLIVPWVAVLEECWRTVVVERPGSAIMVHLADVTFVDAARRELLTRMYRQGVTLVPSGIVMKAIVEEIEADVGRERLHSPNRLLKSGEEQSKRRSTKSHQATRNNSN